MQLIKRLNYLLLGKMIFFLFLLVFIYFFYQLVLDFYQYRMQKREPGVKVVKREILNKSEKFFSSAAKFRPLAQFDIFSKGTKFSNSDDSKEINMDRQNFILLGVVKVGKLFVVIQFKKDKKIRLYPEKSSINRDNYVEKIEYHHVFIRDGKGSIRTHKVFKYKEIKTINEKELQKFSDSPSIRNSQRVKRKKGA